MVELVSDETERPLATRALAAATRGLLNFTDAAPRATVSPGRRLLVA